MFRDLAFGLKIRASGVYLWVPQLCVWKSRELGRLAGSGFEVQGLMGSAAPKPLPITGCPEGPGTEAEC